MTLTFGRLRKDSTRGREFIRNFPAGTTRLRLLQEPPEFLEYQEHWDSAIKTAYPCTGTEQCVGCRSMDEQVARTTWKYVFNALDSKGAVKLFKIGTKLMKDFEARWRMYDEQLTTHDMLIMRDGTGKDTVYAVEILQETLLDSKENHVLKEAGEMLSAQYSRAISQYSNRQRDLGTVKLEPFEEALVDMMEEKENDPPFDPLEATLKELRQYCDTNGIKMSGTATRNTIVAAVQSHMQ